MLAMHYHYTSTFVYCVILQDMYQFVLTTERVNLPFTPRAILPRQEIPVCNGDDLLSDHSLKESIVMIEDTKEMEIDSFLDMILEVTSIWRPFLLI